MPTFDYGSLKEVAETLLTEFGLSAVLKTQTNGGTSWAPSISTTTAAVTLVDTNERHVDANGMVGQTSRTFYISTRGGAVPKKADLITFGGRDHEVTEVRPLAPGGITLLYEVDVDV